VDLVATILACSLHFDDALVRALAQSNSRGNPNFVFDPTVEPARDPRPPPRTAVDALAVAEQILAKHAVPLLGLMQVSPAWMAAFGRHLADAFDPCSNIAVGSAMLSEFDGECSRNPPHDPKTRTTDQRACVLRHYADALQMPELVAVVTLELRFQRASSQAGLSGPIFPALVDPPWGPGRIFASWVVGPGEPGE
jgi:hypothetical protein